MAAKSSAQRPGTILIADDHDVVRQGLGHVLRRGLGAASVAEAATFDEALALLADRSIFLAIFDIRMPGLESPRELVKVRRLRPDVCVVVLSGSEARADILAALEAGVHGYLVKSERAEMLVKRVKGVLGGEIYVPPGLAELPSDVSIAPATMPGGPPDGPSLTKRQKDVLRLLIEGLSNKDIAKRLDVAEGTVKLHVAATLRAVGANNRTHAAALGKKFLD